jgi:phenylacetate-coenzyme A ligase PaaK-like adenylate-forming protein
LPEPFGVIISVIKKRILLPFQANISLVTELYVMKGYYRITGRVDDVVIVSGHNLEPLPLKMLLTSIQQLLSQQL